MQGSRNVASSRDFGPLDVQILIASTMSSSEELQQQSWCVEFGEEREAHCRNLADTVVRIHFSGISKSTDMEIQTKKRYHTQDLDTGYFATHDFRVTEMYSKASSLDMDNHVLQEQWFQSLRSEMWVLSPYLDAFEISFSEDASRATFDVCISLFLRPSHRQRRSYREAKITTEQQQWTLYVHCTWKQQRKNYE